MSSSESPYVDQMLALKAQYLIPCVYHFYRNPMVLSRGEGAWLFDHSGKRYLDAYSGVGVVNCGHCNPEIIAATEAQLHQLHHTTTIYLTEPMLRLAEGLDRFVPGRLKRSFFCTSGSEANEGALLLARLATGRSDFVSLSRSLHGRTHLTAGLTGLPFWRTDPYPPSCVHFVASPVCKDCPHGKHYPECDLYCTRELEQVLDENKDRIAAMIAEPVHGNGGIVVPPPGWFRRVKEILEQQGVLLIMDEAQTGFCRTGRRFGFEWEGIEPDILTLCKALGNGMPIAAFMTTDEIAGAYTRPGASTFGGNPVCARTALAALNYMQAHQLEQKAKQSGQRLRRRMEALAGENPVIAGIRGRGLMLGLELADHKGAAAADLLDGLLEWLKDNGVLAGKTGPGRNVLTLMPPLILTADELDHLCRKLEQAFEEVEGF
ncbi:MAG TPA: aspartate aminotransferase family protein [Sedimenticola sp.]|nr:aspartate aminotransferase family protein [Sedimenticola sp.]